VFRLGFLCFLKDFSRCGGLSAWGKIGGIELKITCFGLDLGRSTGQILRELSLLSRFSSWIDSN
jgi:hypothetical protein